MAVAEFFGDLVGGDAPVAFRGYDGSRAGPAAAPATVVVRSPRALRRLVTAPNELGVGRAYVAGEIDLDGDIFAVLVFQDRLEDLTVTPTQIIDALKILGLRELKPLAPPPEEARLHGPRHSKARDAVAISVHHYDVSNEFYRIVLGPSMTYSCAVWSDDTTTLEQAQANKYELVCRKLGLEPGMRLLDVGCGWGGMILHVARHHGVRAVGVTLSRRQAEFVAKRIADLGLTGQVEVRCEDYRDIADGPYDAISSIGMFEHVGWTQLDEYFSRCHDLLVPGGRLLNHAISEPPYVYPNPLARVTAELRARFGRGLGHDFFNRYVFPDGELHEVGLVTSAIQRAGFEARHVESLREHYALTLRRWVQNLEADWDRAVAEAGEARARVWRLYIAASAVGFEANRLQIHQVLATKDDHGHSGMPLRPDFS